MRLTSQSIIACQDHGRLPLSLPIGDFPRIGQARHNRRGSEIYQVPAGVTVTSYDHEAAEVVRANVVGFAVDRARRCVSVQTARHLTVDVSDDESLAVFDAETGQLAKRRPADSLGQLVPVIKQEEIPGREFTATLGWWYGALATNGWLTPRTVGYSKVAAECRREFERIARAEINSNFASYEYFEDKRPDKFSSSVKIHLNGVDLACAPFSCYADRGIGRGALYKKIPDEILSRGSRECLLGVLSGLLDGDRHVGWNLALEKPRPTCRFHTSSAAMISSLQQLGRYLGIRMSLTEAPARGRSQKSWIVSPSLLDLQPLVPELTCVREATQQWLPEFANYPVSHNSIDIVPLPRALAEALSRRLLPQQAMTHYSVVRRGINIESISRATALRLLDRFPEFEHPQWEPFIARALNDAVHWDRVKSVTPIEAQDVFDLILEPNRVFMLQNGLIIYAR